jgi:hypothetical protein
MLQQGNEIIVTGLRDAPPPPQLNQGTNDNQDINLEYVSAEEIAAQIKREKARTEVQLQVQQEAKDLRVSESLSYSKMKGDREPKRTKRSDNR